MLTCAIWAERSEISYQIYFPQLNFPNYTFQIVLFQSFTSYTTFKDFKFKFFETYLYTYLWQTLFNFIMYLYLLHEVQSLHKFEMTKDMTFQQKVTWRTFAFLFCEMQSFVVNRQTERGWKLRAVENLFKILLFWAEPAEHRIDFTMGETIKGHRNDEMTNWTTMPSFISRFRRRKVNAHWYKSVKSGKNGKLTYQKSEKEKTWKITEKRGLKDLSSVRIWAHSSLPETIIFQFGQLDYIGGKWIKSLQLLKLPSCRVFACKDNK